MKKRILNSITAVVLCGAMLTNFTACQKNYVISAEAKELTSGYTRTATDEGEVTDEFKQAFAAFSFKLMKGQLQVNSKKNANELVSPLSAVIALAMLANGAKGDTLTELENLFEMDIENLNRCLYAYTKSLYTADDCKVNLADSIWNKNDGRFTVNEEFLQSVADWYDAEVFSVPFDAGTVKDINNWCSGKTNGLINNVVNESILKEARMALINALLFDAKWETPYEKSDIYEEVIFHNYDGSEAKVNMLNSEETFYKGTNYRGMSKDYAGGRYSLLAVLPDAGIDAYDFLAGIDADKWFEILGSRNGTANVQLPEFKYDVNMDMIPVLKSLGVSKIFDCPDLTGLGTYEDGSSTYVGNVIQKTYIEVDRNGTKAAAVTVIIAKDECVMVGEDNTVILDRPFVYAIIDNNTGLPLFLGVMAWANE